MLYSSTNSSVLKINLSYSDLKIRIAETRIAGAIFVHSKHWFSTNLEKHVKAAVPKGKVFENFKSLV